MKTEWPQPTAHHLSAPAFERDEPPQFMAPDAPLWSTPEMQNAFSVQPPPRSQAPPLRFPQGPAQQPPPPSDSVEASQKYTGCAEDLPPTPTMSGMPEISLTKPERFTEVRFRPETRTQGLGSFAPPPSPGRKPVCQVPPARRAFKRREVGPL